MEEESQKAIEHFNFEEIKNTKSLLPYKLYKKIIHGNEVYLTNSGIDPKFKVNSVGTIPAALTVYELHKNYNFDLIINPGTAGGFSQRGGEIGDIYLATEVLFHHRNIPMGPYEPYGIGRYQAFDFKKINKKIKFKTGVFSSSDSLTCNKDEMEFFTKNEVVVKEMEAAAIAYICELVNIPYLGIKSITDIVDGGRVTSEEFLENLEKASHHLQDFLSTLLEIFPNN